MRGHKIINSLTSCTHFSLPPPAYVRCFTSPPPPSPRCCFCWSRGEQSHGFTDRSRDGRGAVGIGVCRPCGERCRELRGVHGAGRAGGAAVRGVQGGGLPGGGRVAALLLLALVVGEDRGVGARRVQGGEHAVGHAAAPGGHLRHALHALLRARLCPSAAGRREQGGGRAYAPRQDRRRRRRQAPTVPVAAVVRLPLRQLQPRRHRPALRPRGGAPRYN
jgi:hypothetical protein